MMKIHHWRSDHVTQDDSGSFGVRHRQTSSPEQVQARSAKPTSIDELTNSSTVAQSVFPARRLAGPDGRCRDVCESTERAMRRANPKLGFDLADSAMTTCYHCRHPVCLSCQTAPVDTDLAVCDPCGELDAEWLLDTAI